MKKLIVSLLVLVSPMPCFAWNDTVNLRPGECIRAGGRNICAPSQQIQGQSPVVIEPKILEKQNGKDFKICKYGFHEEAGNGPIKGWALYDVTISNGTKKELFIKMYENHIGKDGNLDNRAERECQLEASRLTDREFQVVQPTLAYPVQY